MIGTTREEMAAFYCIDQEIAKADQAAVEGVFASVFPSGHRPYYDEIRRMRASGTQCGAAGRPDERCDVPHRQPAHGRMRGPTRARPAYVYQFDWQSPAGFEVLPLPRNSVRVQQFRELDRLADAQGREARGDRGACRGDARRLDRIRADRKARSPALAGLAALPARGPHDHALRQRDRTGQRPRRACMRASPGR